MPRHSELRYSKRDGHYSTINGTKFYFGKDKTAARRAFIEKLAQHNRGEVLANPSVSTIIHEFLAFKEVLVSPTTYEWYRYPLEDFIQYFGAKKKVSGLAASDIEVWIKKNWSKSKRNKKPLSSNSVKQPTRAIKTCLSWAVQNNRIGRNPIKSVEVGDYTGSKDTPTTEQIAAILKHFEDDIDFVDLLQFEAITGARVEEARSILSNQVDLKKNEIELSIDQTKMYERLNEKRVRIIVLNNAAKKLVERNLKKHPDGLLFQNPQSRQSNNAWTPAAVRSRFRRAEETLGFRIKQRGLRHYFATEFLTAGGSLISGSILMGHSSTKMIDRNYQDVIKNRQHLLDQANIVRAIKLTKKK